VEENKSHPGNNNKKNYSMGTGIREKNSKEIQKKIRTFVDRWARGSQVLWMEVMSRGSAASIPCASGSI
jgi:hypothetical protein